MKPIRINAKGDGEWIMERCGGAFRPGVDQSMCRYDGEERLGGFVFTHFLGSSIAVHSAGERHRWVSRELIWMLFDYAFNQLGTSMILAPVASDNYPALIMDMRVGFTLQATIRDAYEPGKHLMILALTKRDCRWLSLKPRQHIAGKIAA